MTKIAGERSTTIRADITNVAAIAVSSAGVLFADG
jgi:hypothetical protein